MLYVSRALKCKWLLERREIINPKYLEDVLYPQMVMPAISKFKHWLYIKLTEPVVCQEFYEYYKNIKFDYAVKFLRRCDNEFLLNEFPNILIQVSPHYLKILGEKYPVLVKIYFDSLATDNELVKRYLKDEQKFYNSIKCLLKSDPDLFLDITERYNSLKSFAKLSPFATKYILRCRKSRFMAKSELYVAHLLHMPTVAHQLSVEECQEVVVKLARAGYLSWWFSYANVEPLLKRVSRKDRAAFKKKVFVQKDIGERIAEWPYTLPGSPVIFNTSGPHVFHDLEYDPIGRRKIMKRVLKKKKGSGNYTICEVLVKSELQKLFDEFRFIGFEGTLHELRDRLRRTAVADRRRDMLLVLVSKTGGRPESVQALLYLALTLQNEPVHERAAIVRSLVKRAKAWRLPQDVWDMLLEYSHDLGLDGTQPEAHCREGLHAVVLRQLLADGDCEPLLRSTFLDHFSTLEEYNLTVSERSKIAVGLQRILISSADDAKPEEAVGYLDKLLDVLERYRLTFKSAVSAVGALAERDFEAARTLLIRLYKAGVGRRELLRQYLQLRHDNAALVNALRHDPTVLKPEFLIELLINGKLRAVPFFLKLDVYFSEPGGLANQVRGALKDKILHEPDARLARPLAILLGSDLQLLWNELDNSENYKVAAALRANMHLARPAPDALAIGWRKVGMKAVAWRAFRCRPAHIKHLVHTLLSEDDKRLVRLALALAQCTDCVADSFAMATKTKPQAVLRAALFYYRSMGEAGDLRIWDMVKSYITNVNLTVRKGLRYLLQKVDWIPNAIKAEYCAFVYLALDKTLNSNYIRRVLMKHLPAINESLLRNILFRSIEDLKLPESYPALVIRYLMLSKSDTEFNSRFEEIGKPFLDNIILFNDEEDAFRLHYFARNLRQIMATLLYNSAFFDLKYPCCLAVIERILTWMKEFLPKEIYFEYYVKMHATMSYFTAVRQSIKQNPEIFQDLAKKMSEGVIVVGFTFGRYIAKELAELQSKYFDSVIELYLIPFTDFLTKYYIESDSTDQFIAAVAKGILTRSEGNEGRLALHVLNRCFPDKEDTLITEFEELVEKSNEKEVQMFAYAEVYN